LRRRRILPFGGPPPEEIAAPDAPPGLEEIEEQQAMQKRLADGLAELPGEVRELIEWKHRDGQTIDQIARQTGRPAGTIKSLLSRAYQALRVRMSGKDEEEP